MKTLRRKVGAVFVLHYLKSLAMEILQLCGLAAMTTVIASAGFVLYTVEIDHSRSISWHIAKQRPLVLLFGVSSAIAAALLYIFIHYWYTPLFQLPAIFEVLFVAAIALQVVAAWIPDYGDAAFSSRMHRLLAFTMAALMPVLLLTVLVSATMGTAGKIIIVTACVAMTLYGSLFLLTKRLKHTLKKQFLIHQSAYIALFYAALIGTAFL